MIIWIMNVNCRVTFLVRKIYNSGFSHPLNVRKRIGLEVVFIYALGLNDIFIKLNFVVMSRQGPLSLFIRFDALFN